jgi:hypothetical protein
MRFLPVLIFSFFLGGVAAQPVQSLWHAGHVGYRLPGTMPTERFVLTLPGYGGSIYNSAFSYNQLVRSNTNNVYTLDVDRALSLMDEVNTLDLSGTIPTLGVGWRMGNLWIEVGHQLRFENSFRYPRDLFGVLFKGNAAYIGETANLGLDVHSFNYSELYGGVTVALSRARVGARLKMLNGAVAARTERSRLDLFTSDDVYQLTLDSDYLLHTSTRIGVLHGDEEDVSIGFRGQGLRQLLSRNVGFAFDLGMSVDITERLLLDAAVMDVGSILWKDDLRGYQSQKTIQYDGFVFDDIFSGDSLSLVNALDTLQDLLGFEEVDGQSFRTRLPLFYQVGLRYSVNDWLDLSALVFGQQRNGYHLSGVSLGSRIRVWRILETGLTYTMYDRTFNNLGLHALLKLGPVRVFAASDNVLSLLLPDDSRLINGRAGLQVAF